MSVETIALAELISLAPKDKAGPREHLPILSMTMKEGLIDQASKFKKRIASTDVSSYNVVKRGQLVVGFPIDEAVLAIQDKYDLAIVSPAYTVWEINKNLVEPKYLEFFLRSSRAISFYKAKLQGSTARRRTLPAKTFLSMQVPLPDLQLQRQLISQSSSIDECISVLLQQQVISESLLNSIFEKTFLRQKELVPSGTIQDLLKLSSGKFLPHAEMNADGEIPVYGANGVIGLHDKALYELPQLIVGRVGSCGKINVTSGPCWVSDNALVASWESGQFLLEFLQFSLENADLGKYASKSSQPLISLSRVSGVEIPVPALYEQEQFLNFLNEIRQYQSISGAIISKLIELRTSLQNRAFVLGI